MVEDATSEEAIIEDALARAGAVEALGEALASAGLSALPTELDALVGFLEGELLDALVGRVHPVTARRIVDEILERAHHHSGVRARPEVGPDTPTVPPPPMAGGAYDALASGEVHTRTTPTWGLRPAAESALPAMWLIVSHDEELLALARDGAPADTELVEVASIDTLEGALARSDGAPVFAVIDAGALPVPIDRVVTCLALHPAPRVLVWRMDEAERRRWITSVPVSRTWLPCEAEVTPAEIVQLLGA